jgi:GT2 family glycosyltransferase
MIPLDSVKSDPLERVVLAISTFRTDEKVIALLEGHFSEGNSPFAAVAVVDSLSSGLLEQTIRANQWPVHFWNADHNLGAAGNFAKRMEIAAAYGADWCYTVNADGEIKTDAVRAMVECAAGQEKVGAVYPRRFKPNVGNSWEAPRTSLWMRSEMLRGADAVNDVIEVMWGSSNGALYSLAPLRSGLECWTDLWLAWEDLAYSALLHFNGWKQLLCPRAEFIDDYEYQSVRLFNRTIHIADRPAWYAFYHARNLVLIARRLRPGFEGWSFVMRRLIQEAILVMLFKKKKTRRIGLMVRGIRDGLLNKGGYIDSIVTAG